MSAAQQLTWAIRSAMGRDALTDAERLWRVRDLATREPNRPGAAKFGDLAIAYVDGPSCYYQLAELFVEGCYDFEATNPRPRIVDCGGNIGLSVARFRQLYREARITVLEADKEIAEVLRTNLRAWGDGETLVENAAAWTRDGEVSFDAAGADTGRIRPEGGRSVRGIDIARLCEDPVDLLKMDIEGAEYDVVERLCETESAKRVRRIVCEVHEPSDRGQELHGLIGTLADAGFRYQIAEARSAPWIDNASNGSGFRAVPVRGALAMVYAWRPDG